MGEKKEINTDEKKSREEGQVKERARSGGRRRKKVKVKKRKKKIGGGTYVQNRDQASKTGHGTTGLISNSNPYFKDLNFPQLPFGKSSLKFEKSRYGGAVALSQAASQGRLISGAQATLTTSPAGSRSRLLLPKKRLFGGKATELGLQPLQGLNEFNPLSFPPDQAPVQHQSQLSFKNVKEKPRTLLSKKKVRLRPSRLLFGHKSQLVTSSKRPEVQEPQFFTNVNIRFKPPQFQPSPAPAVEFQSSQSSGSIQFQTSQDPTEFQLASFQPPKSQSRFQKSQSQGHLLTGLDGSYTINTDL